MITKAFEVRDSCTFIPVVAIKMMPSLILQGGEQVFDDRERYLLRRAGYNFEHPSILLCRMEASGVRSNATYDAYAWDSSSRTMQVAHLHIEKNFDALDSGDVIDVEFILGEKTEKKVSERLGDPFS